MLTFLFLFSLGVITYQSCPSGLTQIDGLCTCPLGTYFHEYACIPSCPTSYYANSTINQCVPCPRGCQVCTSSLVSSCTTTLSTFTLDANSHPICEFPTYLYLIYGALCPNGASVVNYNITHKLCISCDSLIADAKYYDAALARVQDCPLSCLTCIKVASGVKCLRCISPFVLNLASGQCTAICTGYNSGTACADSTCAINSFYEPTLSTCSSSCTVNSGILTQYNPIKICGSCDSTCSTCLNSNDAKACSSCASGLSLIRSASSIRLETTTFINMECLGAITDTNTFQSYARSGAYYYCSPECLTCSKSSYNCLSCALDYELNDDGVCNTPCPSPYAKIGSYCVLNVTLSDALNALNNALRNITGTLKNLADAAVAVTNLGSKAVPSLILVSQIMKPGTSSASTRTQSLNMLLYLRYMNIKYTDELSSKFNDSDSSSYQISFEFPEAWVTSSDDADSPYRYSKYGISGLFLVNFWGNIITCAIIIAVTIPFAYLQYKKVEIQNPKIQKSVNAVKNIFVWNYLLSFVFSSLSDAFFFMIVQYQSYNNSSGSATTASLAISCILAILIITLGTFFLVRKYEKIYQAFQSSSDEIVSQSMPESKVLYKDFKHEKRMQLYFMMIYGYRVVLYIVFLTAIADYPVAQSSILAVLNVLMVVYIAIYRPYDEFLGNLELMFYELTLLVANVLTAGMAICESSECSSDTSDSLTSGLLTLNVVLTIGALCLSFYSMISAIFETVYTIIKRRRSKVKPAAGDVNVVSFSQFGSVETPKPEIRGEISGDVGTNPEFSNEGQQIDEKQNLNSERRNIHDVEAKKDY